MEFLTPETQATILQVLAVLTVAMPLLEKLVKSTKTNVDDKVLYFVQKCLQFVPRVRLGK
jgi:hypothetical protein